MTDIFDFRPKYLKMKKQYSMEIIRLGLPSGITQAIFSMAMVIVQSLTNSFYWVSRMIAAMADASYAKSLFHIERYEEAVLSAAHALVNQYDAKLAAAAPAARAALREEANLALAAMIQEKASDTLDKVLFELSNQMKNAYSRSDA